MSGTTIRPINIAELDRTIKRLVEDSDQRLAQEDPELYAKIKAAQERTSKEIIEPTSTGYELKPWVK